MKFKLIVTIVPHNSGDFIIKAAKEGGATGATVLMGKGTASSSVLQMLGFGDTSKDIVLIVAAEETEKSICEKITQASDGKKGKFGVLFILDAGCFIKSGKLDNKLEGDKQMEKQSDYQMINIIVNKGFAEESMDAARKAGAGGGTILNAHGTAKEGDAKFFGMEIVPEKEMLIILVPSEKKDDIIKAITTLPCFSKAGNGIIFCNNAQNFTLLGKN